PHNRIVSGALSAKWATRGNSPVESMFSRVPCRATRAKKIKKAARVVDTKIETIFRTPAVKYFPAMTAGKMMLGSRLIAKMKIDTNASNAVNLATKIWRVRRGSEVSAR